MFDLDWLWSEDEERKAKTNAEAESMAEQFDWSNCLKRAMSANWTSNRRPPIAVGLQVAAAKRRSQKRLKETNTESHELSALEHLDSPDPFRS